MKRQTHSLDLRLLDFIRSHRLMDGVRRLLVAVSGGPDSVCLLCILARLREELGVEVYVAHLDHQLRGKDSAGDARYVEELARRLGLQATVDARDVKSYRASRHISLEEAARDVRYAFLAEVTQSVGAGAVAVGHTRDDNVETILMHIIRGTGTRGLRGLLPATDLTTASGHVNVIRPLLDTTREETAAYCSEHGLAPRSDETNLSFSLFRNRIRLQLLPLLKTYNPQIEAALYRTSKIASDEFSFLDERAAGIWAGIASKKRDAVVLEKDGLTRLHPALKRHILRLAIKELIEDLKDIETRHVEELLEAIEKPAGKVIQLPGGLVFVVEYDRYVLARDTVSLCPFPPLKSEFALSIPGETVASGWKVTASIFPLDSGLPETGTKPGETRKSLYSSERDSVKSTATPNPGISDRGLPLSRQGMDDDDSRLVFQHDESNSIASSSLTACFDYARIGDRLTVRAAQAGDRFEPLGLGASKKVGEFMLDARIPRSWRKRVPLVLTPEQVAWVVGSRIDERLQVRDVTKIVLCLDFSRLT